MKEMKNCNCECHLNNGKHFDHPDELCCKSAYRKRINMPTTPPVNEPMTTTDQVTEQEINKKLIEFEDCVMATGSAKECMRKTFRSFASTLIERVKDGELEHLIYVFEHIEGNANRERIIEYMKTLRTKLREMR